VAAISGGCVAVLEGHSETSIDRCQISTRRFEIQIGRAEMAAPFQRSRAGQTGISGLRFGVSTAGHRFSRLGPSFTEKP